MSTERIIPYSTVDTATQAIVVFGAGGMLASYVVRLLCTAADIYVSGRFCFDILQESEWSGLQEELLSLCERYTKVYLINCAGIIPQKGECTPERSLVVNSRFPHFLADCCTLGGDTMKLVHITTDCVYAGTRGNYTESDPCDTTTVYGSTKARGEPCTACVIRTSIIGEETNGGHSLLEWVRSQKAQQVPGYVNHFWNGLTCLQLAKVIQTILQLPNDLWWTGVRHIHSPAVVSKYELVQLIDTMYDLGNTIVQTHAPEQCDRSLSTLYDLSPFQIPSIDVQLNEQYVFDRMYPAPTFAGSL